MLLDWTQQPRDDRGLRVATADGGWDEVPYPTLVADIRGFAAALQRTGAPRHSVVSLLVAEPRQFITAFWGTLLAGMVPSPLATTRSFRGAERFRSHLTKIFAVAAPRIVIADPAVLDFATTAAGAAGIQPDILPPDITDGGEPAPVRHAADDPAILQFTSGSSGTPKGVRVSWGNLSTNVTSIRHWVSWGPDDVFATWLPLHHDMGLIGAMITPLVSRADLLIMTPEQFLRRPLRWLECFGRYGATMTTAPNFGYAYTARRVSPDQLTGLDFSHWRVAILGAERIDPAAVARFAALVRPHGFDTGALIGAYGLAEATLAVSGARPGGGSRLLHLERASTLSGAPARVLATGMLGTDQVGGGGWLVSCGPLLDGVRVRVVDPDGAAVPDGTLGEIEVSADSVAEGYLHADGRRTDFGGTLRTGDAGFLADGELYVLGRLADSLKVRGVTVYAEDLEAELALVDGLGPDSVAVLLGTVDGVDHAVLLAERRPDPSDWVEDAVARMRAALSADVRLVILSGQRGAIERTSSGKPRRRVLWERLLAGTDQQWVPAHGSPPGAGTTHPTAGDTPAAHSLVSTGGNP